MTLPDEWTELALSQVVELQRGFDLPHHARRPGPFQVLTAGESGGWHDEAAVGGPGFTIGRVTNLGKPTWSDAPFWPHNTTMFAKDFKGNVAKWLFHLFETMDFSGFNSGSVQPTLNRNYISAVRVAVPPIREQQAIAEVLGALDDKIAANTALATRAANLAMVEYLASVRESAIQVSIAEATTLVSRGIAPRYVEEGEGTLVLNQKCVRDQLVSVETARWTDDAKVKPEKILRAGDVLVNSTGQGTLGRVARWTRAEVATVDSHITLLRPDPSMADAWLVGQAILAIQEEIEELGEGSTGQTELSRSELSRVHIRIPSGTDTASVATRIRSLSSMQDAVLVENRTLAATRDALLPQLMSGKLRVRDAEKIAAEAGA